MPKSEIPAEWEFELVEGPFQVEDILDQWLLEEEAKRTYDPTPNHYNVSSIPYCFRKQFLERFYENERDVVTLRSFKLGNVIEKNVMHPALKHVYGKEKGNWVQQQGLLSITLSDLPHVQLRGRWDFIIYNREWDAMLEVKTQAWGAEKKFEPSPHHLLQWTPYVHVGNWKHKGIVYLGKKDLASSPTFWMPYFPKVMEVVFSRTRHIHYCVINKVIPEAEALKTWECRYCPKKFCDMCGVVEKYEIQTLEELEAIRGERSE